MKCNEEAVRAFLTRDDGGWFRDLAADWLAMKAAFDLFVKAQDLRDEIGVFYDPTQKPREYANLGERWIAAGKEAEAALRAFRLDRRLMCSICRTIHGAEITHACE
jgi:hypothetical protein